MRTIGIVAIFVLALCAIGEGAMIVRLSRRVDGLGRVVESVPAATEEGPARRVEALPGRPTPMAAPALAARPPQFKEAPAPGSRQSPLQELATPEGRQLLRSALDVINEERRQEHLIASMPRREERAQRWMERIGKSVPLTSDETVRLQAMYAELKSGRQQVLDEMRGGGKTAEQANDAMDELRDKADKSVRALLGEERWKKAREEARNNRDRQQQGPAQAQGQPAPAAQ
jgi:hypothetical protein